MSRRKHAQPGNVREEDPRIGALLRLAWQRIRERIYSGVRSDGYDDLNRAHVALFRYEGLDGRRPTQLAEYMQITKQSVNDLIRHLERCGYAESRPDANDKRARLLCLTARGRRLEAAVRKYARAAEHELENELGAVRFHEFLTTLRKINGLPG
jgi:DNA-binding MarR family transcriptional regulator